MAYITHKRAENEYQLLMDHLSGTAQRAADFAAAFGARDHAWRTGMLHDIGKFSQAGQRRQLDPEHTVPVDHSTAGAQVALNELRDVQAAFAIAGHHGGLPNAGSAASLADGTLMARKHKALTGEYDASCWREVFSVPMQSMTPPWLAAVPRDRQGFANALYIRMLFSCLVDADYLDTEAFMSGGAVRRGGTEPMEELLARLREYTAPWLSHSSSEINRMRSDLLRCCLHGGEQPRGLYTLTVPTGGGKTVSSLAFALSHAARHRLSRLIYVVPYTSIIEQNAQVFRDILGDEAVLEHHANADLDGAENSRSRLAAENWDASVVVTTAVQFFESLFSSRTSRCRKLHSIANAVVIFDEAQMLPVPYLQPCVNTIAELVQHYGVTAVLCTATQPALDGLIHAYAPGLPCREIAQNTEEMYRLLRRVRFVREDCVEEESLAESLNQQAQVLCIVNTRKRAKQLFERLEPEGRFHLSTLMTPDSRTRMLKEIRRRLAERLPCRVVSTSLIEAGVDVDFPSVWREEAGLDSVLQAAGRCNREGKRRAEESIVHMFRFEQAPPRMFHQNIYALRKTVETQEDWTSLQAIKAYFQHLLFAEGPQALDERQIVEKSKAMAFRDVDDAFQMIDSQTVPVYIPTADNAEPLQRLREGTATRADFRVLGRSAVNVYPQHFQALRSALECPAGDRFGILLDPMQYDGECGLALEPELGNGWFA